MLNPNPLKGHVITTLIRGAETSGRLAVVALHETAGNEPPRHLHEMEDEIVYILEGQVLFSVGDAVRRTSANECIVLPRGIEHSYAVESNEARMLVALAPAGLESCYDELGTVDRPLDVEQLITTAARYGVAITGPSATVAELEWASAD